MALSAADRGARTGRRLTPATRAALQAGLTLREVSTPPKFPRLAPDARLTSEPQATLLCHPTLTGTPGQTSGFWQTPWLGAVCTLGGGPQLSPHYPGGGPLLPSSGVLQPSTWCFCPDRQAGGRGPCPHQAGKGARPRPRPGQPQSLRSTPVLGQFQAWDQSWTVVLAWGWMRIRSLFL